MNRTLQAVMLIGALQLFVRASDLLQGDPVPHSMSVDAGVVEGTVWGVSCVLAGVFIIASLIFRSPQMAVTASFVAFSIYAMFGYLVIDDTIMKTPPDDWRLLGDHLAMSLIWLTIGASISFRHGVHRILERKKDARGVD